MAVKYLYLDDESPDKIQGYIRAVERESDTGLEIERIPPRRYDRQVEAIRNLPEDVDGVILDFRLDMKSNEIEGEKEGASYRAASIAQEIRSLGTEGKVEEMPLVLWSLSRRYKESYSPDETAHDLFDLTSTKDKLGETEGAQKMATRLVSLTNGYNELRRIIDENRKRKRFTYKLLGLEENPDFLDQRIVTYFDNQSALPIHEYARFILREVLAHTRPLVDEAVLAARLGVHNDGDGDRPRLCCAVRVATRTRPTKSRCTTFGWTATGTWSIRTRTTRRWRCASRARNSNCSIFWPPTRAGCSRARKSSTRSGAATSSSWTGPWTCTSERSAKRLAASTSKR